MHFLDNTINGPAAYTECVRGETVTTMEIVYSLNRYDSTFYGCGAQNK